MYTKENCHCYDTLQSIFQYSSTRTLLVNIGLLKKDIYLLACLLFGAADAAQMQIQVMNLGVPYQFLLMIPYIMAMLAMVGFVGKVRSPAAMGKPYVKH